MSKIEWCDKTWNCVTGCSWRSISCDGCYARRMTKRLQGIHEAKIASGISSSPGIAKYAEGFDKVVMHWDELGMPSEIKKPSRIFVNSMSDTFHKKVSISFIMTLFEVMGRCYKDHQYQLLTKRSERLLMLSNEGCLDWYPNIWMGVTIEHEQYLHRLSHLRATGAMVKFLSLEPLLGRMSNLDLTNIDQVICGAETGPGARYMNPDWAREIRDSCKDQGVAFFMKKMSNKETIPDDLMIREFPDAKG